MFEKEPNVEINDVVLRLVELYSYKLDMEGYQVSVDDIINGALVEYLTDKLCENFCRSNK